MGVEPLLNDSLRACKLFIFKGEKMSTTTCPECAADIELEAGTEENEIIVCPDCGVDLEVTSLNPLTVELAPMEAEDWGE
jgi:alpha-aminoadipate/glutamate carrier protein LysW